MFFSVSGVSADLLVYLGVLSAVLSGVAFLPYIIDTAKHRTRPERASWLIWSVLGAIALASQVAEGATASLWFAAVQVVGTIIIFAMAIIHGSGAFLCLRNRYVLGFALCGLVAWYFTDTSAYALAITIGISLLGGCVTVVKAFRAPHSETLSSWVMLWGASVCALLSVGTMDVMILAYPAYLFVLYSGIVCAILIGRMRRQAPYVETFVWASKRVPRRLMPPPARPPQVYPKVQSTDIAA